MLISEKIFEKTFKSKESSKAAYLKACKWVAKYVIGAVEVGETFWKIEKVKDADFPACRLELFITLDEKTSRQEHCEVCKEFHHMFYINQEYNCETCKMNGYRNRMKQQLQIKKSFRKQQLRRAVDE